MNETELKQCYPQIDIAEGKLNEVVETAARAIEARQRSPVGPKVREIWGGISLMSTFSHLNPNLPSDELWGNVVLNTLAYRLGLARDSVLNTPYDDTIPDSDKPKGHSIQLLDQKHPVLMHKDLPYSNQPSILPLAPDVLEHEKQMHPDYAVNLEPTISRYNEIVLAPDVGVCEKIIDIRGCFLDQVIGPDRVQETNHLISRVAMTLQALAEEGTFFYKMQFPRSKDQIASEDDGRISFVSYLDKQTSTRVRMFLEGDYFVCDYCSIHKDDIYGMMVERQVAPAIQTIILGMGVAQGIPHLGGIAFKEYAPAIVTDLAENLGVDPTGIVLTTEGLEPFVRTHNGCNRRGAFVYFPEVGAETIREKLDYCN